MFSASQIKESDMEKRPLKGNGSSIPLSVPATYQSVGDKVSLYFSIDRYWFPSNYLFPFSIKYFNCSVWKVMVWLGLDPGVHRKVWRSKQIHKWFIKYKQVFNNQA